jgi:undecaprenyl-diphosphatase
MRISQLPDRWSARPAIDEARYHLAHPPTLALAVAAVALASLVLAFGLLPGDVAASRGFQALDVPWLADLMRFGDAAGSKVWLFGLLGVSAIGLATARRWRELSVLGLAALSYTLSPLLKQIIQRPRPDLDGINVLVTPVGYSFPSGHAMGSGLIIGGVTVVAMLLLKGRPVAQAMAATAGLAVLSVIGASRVYLGAHWLSDVVAGYLLAALFLLVATRFVMRRLAANAP